MAHEAAGTYPAGTKVTVNGKIVYSKGGDLVVDDDGRVSTTGDLYISGR